MKIYLRLFKELIVKYNLFFFVTNNVSANLNEGNDASKALLDKHMILYKTFKCIPYDQEMKRFVEDKKGRYSN